MKTTNVATLQMLESAFTESHVSMESVNECFRADAQAHEDLPSYLVRKGALKPEAIRTLDMIQKGYLTIKPSQLVDANRLSHLVSTRRDPASNHHTAPHAIRPVRQSHLSYLENDKQIVATKPINRIGSKLGRCTITRILGEGGGGTVYEGLHKGLGIAVAVKVIKEGLRGESIRRSLRAEARLLAHLDHPNIVRVYDFDDDGDEPFLVMELVAGQSLTELYRQVGPLKPEFAAGAIAQAARGLEAAKAVGVIHRDVKPSNILISKTGSVKIADMGLAVASNQQLQFECGVHGTKDAGTGGTFAYMAPERFSGRGAVEFYSDLYSLGISFFEVVTGQLPYTGTTPFEFMVAHASNEIPLAHDINSSVPPSMSRIIARMMAKEPQDRYQNYTDLIAELIRVCKPLITSSGCSTWNSMWDGLTIEISGVVPKSQWQQV